MDPDRPIEPIYREPERSFDEPLYPDIPPPAGRRKTDTRQVLVGFATLIGLVLVILALTTLIVWWYRAVIG
jgi:hypothetical protein